MPKLGSTLPYRIRYRWTNGAAGTTRAYSADEAHDKAAAIARHARRRDDAGVTITIEHAPKGGPVEQLDEVTIAITDVLEED